MKPFIRPCRKRGNAGRCEPDSSGRCGWCDGVILAPTNNCATGQLDNSRGERVRLVALRVGAVITEREQHQRIRHQVRLYQIAVHADDRVPYPLLDESLRGSEDMRLTIAGELPAGLEPGALLRLLVVEPRHEMNDQDRSYLEETEAAQ